MKRLCTVFAVLFFTFTAAGLLLAQSDPFVGSWKLDVAKSKFDPGPAPQSQARTWDASGKVSIEGVNAAGKPMAYGYTIKDDGTDRLHQANERQQGRSKFHEGWQACRDGDILGLEGRQSPEHFSKRNQPGGRQALYQRYRLGKAVRGFARKTRR